MVDLGLFTLSVTNLYFFVIWVGIGVLCTVLPGHRGLVLACALVVMVVLLPTIFFVNPQPLPNQPRFQWCRFGCGIDPLVPTVLVPLAGAVIGSLAAERLLPEEDE
jgi:hypothetical protein